MKGEKMIRQNKDDLLMRLKKIEGQVRGVSRMIEEERYCVDILMQVDQHVDELMEILQKFVK
ncbi:MAG: metal-sensitive transcriptional regulator [Carboxydocellales bacterium]